MKHRLVKIYGGNETTVRESHDQFALYAERDTLNEAALAAGNTLTALRYAVRPASAF